MVTTSSVDNTIAVYYHGYAVRLRKRSGLYTGDTTSEGLERVAAILLDISKVEKALSPMCFDDGRQFQVEKPMCSMCRNGAKRCLADVRPFCVLAVLIFTQFIGIKLRC